MFNRFAIFFGLLLLASSTFAKHKKVKPGHWHAKLQLTSSVSLPFKIIIEKEKQLSGLTIVNGEESIALNEVSSKGDSIYISFSAFASELRAKVIDKKHISGYWYNHAKAGHYKIPFQSWYGDCPSADVASKKAKLNGRWEVTFGYDHEDPYKAIGLFDSYLEANCSNDPERFKGTFLTETGDYRFLDGQIQGDDLMLSTFDGSHAFLFQAHYKQDTLWGDFYSGTHYHDHWFAVRNETYELKHPDSLTYLVNDQPIEFTLKDLNHQDFVYPNEQTKGKVTLIQIMGTWCPNCLDESKYLKGLYEAHRDELEIIAVGYETQSLLDDKIEKVKKYKEFLGLDYTFLIGGDACKSCASREFAMLNKIISFPTLIFIDKQGKIRKIHTGFNGPGTGAYYDDFVSSTNDFVRQLIEE